MISASRKNIWVVSSAIFVLLAVAVFLSGKLSQTPQNATVSLRNNGAIIVAAEHGNGLESVTFTRDLMQPDSLHTLLQLRPVRAINMDACQKVRDDWLEPLTEFRGLQILNLGGTKVTDRCIDYVVDIPQIEELYLWRTFVTDAGVNRLSECKKLRLINLWDTQTSDECLKVLATMDCLERVYLGTSPEPQTVFANFEWTRCKSTITKQGVARLRQERPDLAVYFWDAEESAEAPILNSSKPARSLPASETESNAHNTSATNVAIDPPKITATSKAQTDWPAFLGPNGDGSSNETLINTNWKKHPPALLWQRRTAEGYSAPSVSGHQLFYSDRVESSHRLFCIDVRDGRELWKTSLPSNYDDALGYSNGPRTTPLVDGPRVYTMTATGLLACLSCDSGKAVWSVDTATKFGVEPNLYGVGSSPIVFGDLLLCIIGGSANTDNHNQPAGLVAFDKHTGATIWATTEAKASYSSIKVIENSTPPLAVAFVREGLMLFEVESGLQLDFVPWAAKVSGCVNAATPVLDQNQVFISEAYGPGSAMFEVRNNRFREWWRDRLKSRTRAMRAHWATPILHDGFLYGCSGRHSSEGTLRCVDWITGVVLWKHEQKCLSSVCHIGDHLINLTEFGDLSLIKLDWKFPRIIGRFTPNAEGVPVEENQERLLKYACWAAPVIADSKLIVRGKDRIAAFELNPPDAIPQR